MTVRKRLLLLALCLIDSMLVQGTAGGLLLALGRFQRVLRGALLTALPPNFPPYRRNTA